MARPTHNTADAMQGTSEIKAMFTAMMKRMDGIERELQSLRYAGTAGLGKPAAARRGNGADPGDMPNSNRSMSSGALSQMVLSPQYV